MRIQNIGLIMNLDKNLRNIFLLLGTMSLPLIGICGDNILSPYFSPGVQIGYRLPNQFFVAGQLTLGFTEGKPGHDELILFPGTSIGALKYFGSSDRIESYLDFQVSFLGFTGVGYGVVRTKFDNQDKWEIGSRWKLWGGAYGLLVYDRTKYPNFETTNSIGLMGVFPFVEPHIPPD